MAPLAGTGTPDRRAAVGRVFGGTAKRRAPCPARVGHVQLGAVGADRGHLLGRGAGRRAGGDVVQQGPDAASNTATRPWSSVTTTALASRLTATPVGTPPTAMVCTTARVLSSSTVTVPAVNPT